MTFKAGREASRKGREPVAEQEFRGSTSGQRSSVEEQDGGAASRNSTEEHTRASHGAMLESSAEEEQNEVSMGR